jgi:hypothetical protein
MFMEEGIAARPLPHESIIKEVWELKEEEEVREATQRNRLARGAE